MHGRSGGRLMNSVRRPDHPQSAKEEGLAPREPLIADW
jgi:hypothetical protein